MSRAARSRRPRGHRRGRPDSRLARRRRRENMLVGAGFALTQVVTWLLTGDWWWRLGSFLLALLALPVVVTLVFDRRY